MCGVLRITRTSQGASPFYLRGCVSREIQVRERKKSAQKIVFARPHDRTHSNRANTHCYSQNPQHKEVHVGNAACFPRDCNK